MRAIHLRRMYGFPNEINNRPGSVTRTVTANPEYAHCQRMNENSNEDGKG